MARIRIKFCGITRAEDAQAAVALGVDALGFVFYKPSPRYISPDDAAAIIAGLPPLISKVGLLVNATPDEMAAAADSGIDCVQFHGDESAASCALSPLPWMRAVRVRTRADVTGAFTRYADACALLLDAWQPDVYGGSGKQFDWSLIPAERPRPIILAGGLDAGNVAHAIRQARPYAVDVSGGIEAAKGENDVKKMQQFVEEVTNFERTG